MWAGLEELTEDQLLDRITSEEQAPGMCSCSMSQTFAAEILATKNTVNRNRRTRHVQRYHQDMQDGTWNSNSPNMLLFDWDGHLINGQHRLSAFIGSKIVRLVFVVAYGCDPSIQDVIDRGAPRTVGDDLRMAGYSRPESTVALIRGIYGGWDYYDRKLRQLNPSAVRYLLENDFNDVISFIITNVPTHSVGITIAPVLAPIGRAWFTEDRVRIERFIGILVRRDHHKEEESAPASLRELLINNKSERGNKSADLYAKTQNALNKFFRHQPVRYIRSISRELFKLPSDIHDCHIKTNITNSLLNNRIEKLCRRKK